MPSLRRRLLVVGWDSADWNIILPLVKQGGMPMMARILENGVHGNLATLEPSLSPMLWTTIATGHHAAEHGVHGFTEVRDTQVMPVSASSRRRRAVWNILSDHGLVTNLVGWFATQGERDPNVRLVSNLYPHAPRKPVTGPGDWQGCPPGTFWPESLAASLEPLRLHPTELPSDVMRLFVPRLPEIDQARDRRPFLLAERLAESFTVHAAATSLMEHEEWDLTMVYYRAIDEIAHLFMPFHPPRMEGAPAQDFERYRDVVTATYRLHDLLLARLVDLAGPEAAVMVVSDHGFHSDHLRPTFTPRIPAGIVVWHRPYGIVAAAGPGIRQAAGVTPTVRSASLNDVAPTILGWFGLPRAADMAGHPLRDVLASECLPPDIPTWEVAGGSPLPPAPSLGDSERRQLLDHFVALGYIDELPSDQSKAVAETIRENRWQLASALMHAGRHEEALPLLEAVWDESPHRADVAQRLAHCRVALGLADEAQQAIDDVLGGFRNETTILLVRATIALLRGESEKALAHLEAARARDPDARGLDEQLARVLMILRRRDEAEVVARRVVERDRCHAPAWGVIARCALARGDSRTAEEAARESVALDGSQAPARVSLAMALAAQGRREEAIEHLGVVRRSHPGLLPPARMLADLLRRVGRAGEADAVMREAWHQRGVARSRAMERQRRVREDAATRAAARGARRSPAKADPVPPLDIVVVSGLPRSGTSLMMQILRAGGVEVLADGIRAADDSNPEGYWEYEAIKRLPSDPDVLNAADGKAVKVITTLIPSLPRRHRYTVIGMVRPIEQVVDSQRAMLARNGITPRVERDALIRMQTEHSRRVREMLGAADGVRYLEVSFPDLVADPWPVLRKVESLLPGRFRAAPEVAACVRSDLHRERG